MMFTLCYLSIYFHTRFDWSHKLQFVKVNDTIDAKLLLEELKSEWPLQKPNLVISVTGGAKNFPLNSNLREMIRTGIPKAAFSTRGERDNHVYWQIIDINSMHYD